MSMYDVAGAYDMHIHTGPDFVERIGDDLEVAICCLNAGFKGILLKSHMESTVSRAYHTMKQCPDIKVYGALVLGAGVGGLNPVAAEAAMKAGAIEIFMPTFSSAADFAVQGKGAEKLYKYNLKSEIETITVLDENGEIKPEVVQILELARDYCVLVGTGHLCIKEINALCKANKTIGAAIMITHPEYKVPMIDKYVVAELVEAYGVTVELTAGAVFPIPACSTVDKDTDMIRYVGYKNFIITSDAGAPTKPMPPELLSSYLYCLKRKGLEPDKLNYMFRDKPAEVFRLL